MQGEKNVANAEDKDVEGKRQTDVGFLRTPLGGEGSLGGKLQFQGFGGQLALRGRCEWGEA